MNHTTRAIAVEAARLLTSQAEADLACACRKAAKRLKVSNRRLWPDHKQLEQALREQQALFAAPRQHDALWQLRQSALELMDLLEPFRPMLTGPVLSGLADRHSPIELHLFSDCCEDIALHLYDLGLRPQPAQRNFRYPDGSQQSRPQWQLETGQQRAELSCFPLSERQGRAPLEPLSREPMQRLNRAAAERRFEA
ncbi:MAG: hypothetical protein H7842_02030 [Gammaproteobacteria bacterium SHHR-1]|uniref:hypothetical protein n=1 Tax=Magnetovirga frankeli TaxID=947516 RepID=UPI0012931FBA|nr:hypothetical protein D5125_08350 [gamma proteobacterium SS-5]